MKKQKHELASDAYRAHEVGAQLSGYGVEGTLWRHRNGFWYVLYGYRLKKMVSARTKDLATAIQFKTSLFSVKV